MSDVPAGSIGRPIIAGDDPAARAAGLAGVAGILVTMVLDFTDGLGGGVAFVETLLALLPAVPLALFIRLFVVRAGAPPETEGDPPAPGLFKPVAVVLLTAPLTFLPVLTLAGRQVGRLLDQVKPVCTDCGNLAGKVSGAGHGH